MTWHHSIFMAEVKDFTSPPLGDFQTLLTMTHSKKYILYYNSIQVPGGKPDIKWHFPGPPILHHDSCSWGCHASLLPLQGEPETQLIFRLLSPSLR